MNLTWPIKTHTTMQIEHNDMQENDKYVKTFNMLLVMESLNMADLLVKSYLFKFMFVVT